MFMPQPFARLLLVLVIVKMKVCDPFVSPHPAGIMEKVTSENCVLMFPPTTGEVRYIL
jgi:hypothetical protein